MNRIICWLRGHERFRIHLWEPLAHEQCRRCGKLFYNREDDEQRDGYCQSCVIGVRYGIQPGHLAEKEQIEAMARDGVAEAWIEGMRAR